MALDMNRKQSWNQKPVAKHNGEQCCALRPSSGVSYVGVLTSTWGFVTMALLHRFCRTPVGKHRKLHVVAFGGKGHHQTKAIL